MSEKILTIEEMFEEIQKGSITLSEFIDWIDVKESLYADWVMYGC